MDFVKLPYIDKRKVNKGLFLNINANLCLHDLLHDSLR